MKRLFEKYVSTIRALPFGALSKELLLQPDFLLAEEKELKVFYAPHNEYTNTLAKVIIVGICPGWTQTKIAYERARADLEEKIPTEEILKHCKEEARFSGSMRKNLCAMLDELQFPRQWSLSSTQDLFNHSDILHTTSLIPYPVFVKEKNYTGYTPEIVKSEFLMQYVRHHFFEEILKMENKPLIIPLGKAVEEVLKVMVEEGKIMEEQCLFGFPHPSGANGHRIEQFQSNKELLQKKIQLYCKRVDC